MTADKTTRAAGILAAAWRQRRQIPELPDDCRPADRAEAYAVQDGMARLLGLTVAGWKLGMASAAAMRQFGVDGPVPGRLFRETLFESPAVVPAGIYATPKVEPEFAVRLGADLPARPEAYTLDEVEAAVAAMHLAIEVADGRVANATVEPIVMIADNGGAAGFVIGPEIAAWRGVDYTKTPVELWIDGALAEPGLEGDARVDPIGVLLWTANDLSRRRIGLRAGDLVSTGTATVPASMAIGSEAVARFTGLGEVRIRFSE